MSKKSVKLVSAEGFEFIIDHKAACVSNTIKQMLSSEGKLADQAGMIPLYQSFFKLQRVWLRGEAPLKVTSLRRSLARSAFLRYLRQFLKRSANTFTISCVTKMSAFFPSSNRHACMLQALFFCCKSLELGYWCAGQAIPSQSFSCRQR